MNRLVAAAVVLLALGGTVRADMGMPWPLEHYIPVRITLTVDPPPPDVVLFIQDTGSVRRMPTTSPIVIESPPGAGGVGFSIYAVPARVVESWRDGAIPHRDWFGRIDNPDCKWVASGGGKGRVAFGDDRATVELEYRLIQTSDGMRLVRQSENQGSVWYEVVSALAGCCGLPIGIAWLGLWCVKRLFRSRTLPPTN